MNPNYFKNKSLSFYLKDVIFHLIVKKSPIEIEKKMTECKKQLVNNKQTLLYVSNIGINLKEFNLERREYLCRDKGNGNINTIVIHSKRFFNKFLSNFYFQVSKKKTRSIPTKFVNIKKDFKE